MSLKSICIVVLILTAGTISADKVVRFPLFEKSCTPEFKIDSIVFEKDRSLFFFHYDNREGTFDWININSETHIKDNNGTIYPIKGCTNIEESPGRTYLNGKGDITGKITFPFIDYENIKSVDFIENENTWSFNIFGIDISKDGENIGYVDFVDFNRKQNIADYHFSAMNYEKYIQLATPLLSQARNGFGKSGVLVILEKLIDSYVLSNNKNETYFKYLEEYRKICKKQGWNEDLTCSIGLSADMALLAKQIYELHSQNKTKEACALMEEYIPKAKLIYSETDTTYAINNIIYSDMLIELCDYNKAIEARKKTIDEYNRLNNHGIVYQSSLVILAHMYEQNDDMENTVKCYEELYKVEKEIGNIYTFRHAQTGYHLGNLYIDKKKIKEGIDILLDVHDLYSSSKMKIDSLYLSITNVLSFAYNELKKNNDAIDIWEKTTLIVEKRIGKNNFLYFNSVANLALQCRLSDQIGRAIEVIYEIKENFYNKKWTKDYIYGLKVYAEILSEIGDNENALKIFQDIKQIFDNNNLSYNLDYESILLSMASIYINVNDTIHCVEACNTILKNTFGTEEEFKFDFQKKLRPVRLSF